jgi:DNA-binding transcriptional MerR regulator
MGSPEVFTTFQIAKKLNIKYGRLREWLDRGYVTPSIQKADGQGSKNLFSRFDVYMIKLFIYLKERGISRENVAATLEPFIDMQNAPTAGIDDFKNTLGETISGISFLAIRRRSVSGNQEIYMDGFNRNNEKGNPCYDIEELHKDDYAFILNFKKIRNQVDKALQ